MKITDRNACMEAFQTLCDEVHSNENMQFIRMPILGI